MKRGFGRWIVGAVFFGVSFSACGKKDSPAPAVEIPLADEPPVAGPNPPGTPPVEPPVPPRSGEACTSEAMVKAQSEILYHDPIYLKAGEEEEELVLPAEGQHYTRRIVNAGDAWRIGEGSPDIVVAVIDSGVEITHPDLRDNLWVNEKEKNGKKGVDDDGNGFVDDVHGWDFVNNKPASVDGTGHGTHCAGNVAAERNGFGVVGVAPRVRIMPVRFLNSNGSGTTDNGIKAIHYAIDNGAKILTNSWGGSSKPNPCLQGAINRALANGIYFVASAGNGGRSVDTTPSFPGSYPGVISVGNSNESDQRTKSSNYGKSVFIFAPGTDSLSTYKGGTYKELTGTSMSAPQVAGAIALGLSLRPSITMDEMRNALCSGADRALSTISKCGRLDIGQFVRNVQAL